MKTKFYTAAILLTVATLAARAADPRTNSWFTANSSQYARIYTSDVNKTNGTSVTTWSRNTTTQSLPAYCGVQHVYSSANWVYVYSSGLAGVVMGPWYQNAAHTQLFLSYPTNQHVTVRIPRTPTVPGTKTKNGGGPIGIFVDGVVMFNSWDIFVWNGSTEIMAPMGNYYWNRDAYVNEGVTFDPNNAHQAGGQHHYHANPPGLRYQLGDHVDFDPVSKAYTESTNTPTKHSPILGWVADGFPLYGPYGYANPTNADSGVRRMISGYVIRNGQYGTSNLTVNGRSTIPAWAARLFNVASNIVAGPAVSSTNLLGRYMEDNDYLGDHGYVQGVDFDLDEYNGRYCVTPEFPDGTYAYFVSISSNGIPVFPYNIGRGYYGNPTGGRVTSIGESVVTHFSGNTNLATVMNAPTKVGDAVVLTWSALEGGAYMIQSSTDLSTWTTNSTTVTATLNTGSYTNITTESQGYYRVARTALAPFDP